MTTSFVVTPLQQNKMSQMYIPGTILSVGFGLTLEQVIVLTGDKVATKTFAGKAVDRRDIISLADWLLIVSGQNVQTDYIPFSPADAEPQAQAQAQAQPQPQAQAQAQPQAQQEPESYPVGTKLSWKHPEGGDQWFSPNSRTAIVLKDGILQVKEVINSVTVTTTHPGGYYATCAQKFFSSLADWKAQLPEGGSVTVTEATEDFSVPSIQRKASMSVKATDDHGYIKEVQERFSVHAHLNKYDSPAERLVTEVVNVRHYMTLVESLTSPAALASTKTPREVYEALERAHLVSKRLRRSIKKATRIQNDICLMPSKANTNPLWFKNDYKQRLVAFVKDREIDICYEAKEGLLGLAGNPDTGCYGKWFSPKTGKTFAELGIDLKADGKPRLKVYYRRESIEL